MRCTFCANSVNSISFHSAFHRVYYLEACVRSNRFCVYSSFRSHLVLPCVKFELSFHSS